MAAVWMPGTDVRVGDRLLEYRFSSTIPGGPVNHSPDGKGTVTSILPGSPGSAGYYAGSDGTFVPGTIEWLVDRPTTLSHNVNATPAPEPTGGWTRTSRPGLDECAECGAYWQRHKTNLCPAGSNYGPRLWADKVAVPAGKSATEIIDGWRSASTGCGPGTTKKDDKWPHKCYGCGGPAYHGLRTQCKTSCKPEWRAD